MSTEVIELRDASTFREAVCPSATLCGSTSTANLLKASHYPALSLEQAYAAIIFYLGHESEVENDIAQRCPTPHTYRDTIYLRNVPRSS
jgi:hypothetical protein